MDGDKKPLTRVEQIQFRAEKVILFLMAIIPLTVLLILFEIKMAALK